MLREVHEIDERFRLIISAGFREFNSPATLAQPCASRLVHSSHTIVLTAAVTFYVCCLIVAGLEREAVSRPAK